MLRLYQLCNWQNFSKISLLVLFIIIITQNFLSWCLAANLQNPADSFADKKLPRHLERIANQKGEFIPSRVESIKKRVEEDKNKQTLLPVAVIDSGFDLAHPDLEKQIAFDIDEHGHIIGAGKDIFGKDNFPSYVMVDPTLFAFGAKKVEDGLIYEPHDNPIELMYEMDQRFKKILLEKIKNDPELKGSLFLRLNPKTFTIFGMKHLWQKIGPNDQIQYLINLIRKPYLIIDENSTLEPDQIDDLALLYQRLKDPAQWDILDPDTNLPLALVSGVTHIRGFDRFYAHLTEVLKQIDQEQLPNGQQMEFSRHERQVINYIDSWLNPYIKSSDVHQLVYQHKIFQAGAYLLLGHEVYNPAERLRLYISKLLKNANLTKKQALDEYSKIVDKLVRQLDEVIAAQGNLDNKFQFINKSQIAEYRYFAELSKEMLKQIRVFVSDSEAGQQARSFLRKFYYRFRHPYIDIRPNRDDFHGTHVASLAAIQHPDIRIYPIKVGLGPGKYSTELLEKLKIRMEDFKSWTQLPMVKKLISEIQSEYGIHVSKDQMLHELEKILFYDSGLLLSINQLFEAIKEVGGKKIKLVNISLGMPFNKESNRNDDHKDNQIRSLVVELLSEYCKWSMGEIIKQYAPKTLFIIAAGNSGSWLNGVSQSHFPGEIFSPRCDKISKKYNLPPAPNNELRNIITVSSLNSDSEPLILSAFTNITLNPLVTSLFAPGESVNGSVPKGFFHTSKFIDLDKMEIAEHFEKNQDLLVSKLNSLHSMLIYGQNKAKIYLETLLGEIEEMKKLMLEIFNIYPYVLNFWHSKWAEYRTKFSGTSMAAPIAAGRIAKALIEEMTKKNIPYSEIYDHPDFSPDKIIEEIVPKITDRYDIGLSIRAITRGIEKLPEPPVDRIRSLAKKVNKMAREYSCKQLFF